MHTIVHNNNDNDNNSTLIQSYNAVLLHDSFVDEAAGTAIQVNVYFVN